MSQELTKAPIAVLGILEEISITGDALFDEHKWQVTSLKYNPGNEDETPSLLRIWGMHPRWHALTNRAISKG
jgi:hypothetical protein